MRGQVCLAFVLAILCLGDSVRAQNLVSNGSFELPVVSGTFVARSAGAYMSGWTVGGAGIDHIGSFWRAAATNQSVDLNMSAAGSVYQLLSTTPNERYVLRFAMAGNPFGYTNKLMSVRWNGVELTNLVFPWYSTNGPTNMGWRYHSLLATAIAASTRLDFVSLTGVMNGAQGATAYYGPALDDVSVVPFLPPRLEPPWLSSGTATVSWTTYPGLDYQLLVSTNLAEWIPASEWLTAPSTNLSAVAAFDASRNAFFRVATRW